MFNKYYVFVPTAIENHAPLDNTELTVNELERQRLVADAQASLRECFKTVENKQAYRECA